MSCENKLECTAKECSLGHSEKEGVYKNWKPYASEISNNYSHPEQNSNYGVGGPNDSAYFVG